MLFFLDTERYVRSERWEFSPILSFFSAVSRLALLGAMVLATVSYVYMACAHMHRHMAALETFLTASGVKSGFSTYFLSFLMNAGSMLSLS